jgi:hypothetical protein
MSENKWNRVPKEQAHQILKTVSSSADSAVFSEQLTEVTWKNLSFYNNLKRYRLTNYATLPCFTMDYLGDPDSEKFYPLDGLANTIYDANEQDKISLTKENIIDYLDFFFDQVQGPDGDIYLIKTPQDLPMLSSLPENQQQSVIEHHKGLVVNSDIKPGEFHVTGTLYYDGSLISAMINVQESGKLAIQDQTLLLHGIHFPMSPIQHTYMSDT